MKKEEIIKNVSTTFSKVSVKLKKHSPEILVVAGVVGTVASAVMACHATTKLDSVLEKSKKDIDAIHKPMPTLPSVCRTVRQVIAEMSTMVQSNPIFTLENSIWVTEETACIQPSPASGIRSAGRYKKIPNATNTVLARTITMRIARLSGVGR